jgi:predicted AAA+ superfamily ATPase
MADTAIVRRAPVAEWAATRSCFIFGPRLTGKSSLLRRHFAGPGATTPMYDLLDHRDYAKFLAAPHRLGEEIPPSARLVVIDEVQRLPELLNEVHRLIETRRIRFVLTGSSARKLRRGGVNLLGGRARTRYLRPFTRGELGEQFDLNRAIQHGLLPPIYLGNEPKDDLAAYIGNYLQQEIAAEGLTRNVPAFSRFLEVAALSNATVVNFTQVASDAAVPRTTVHEYFEILRDTLIASEIPAFRETKTRKALASSKWYFFDAGVASALQGRLVQPRTPEFGPAFETYLLHELLSCRDYAGGPDVSHWKSRSNLEVDFILGDHTAVEVKGKASVVERDLRGLRALAEERKMKRLICVSLEDRPRRVDGLQILPYGQFLDGLWAGEFKG